MAPPQGLVLGSGKRKWRIGRQLGSGACGTVHELTPTNGNGDDDMLYVAKVAPLPPVAANKKKKKTAEQKNADLLYYERLMYTTHLSKLQGKLIPTLPRGDSSSPPPFVDHGGFRSLIMERMDGPLMDVVPALLKQFKTKKKIPFGPIATTLVDCIQAIHEENLLFVDVKPENFMLACASGKLENRIRMIDLGLLKLLKDTSGRHKQNEETQLVGTPLYSSLNVHQGETLSRRDDLEAIGYVIAELLISLLSQVAGGSKKKRTDQGLLPWCDGTSDDDICRIKKEQVHNLDSEFFVSLSLGGNDDIANSIWAFLREVGGIGFKEKPDYEALKSHFKGLTVLATAKAKSSQKKSPTRARRHAAIRVDSMDESDQEESGSRVMRSRGTKRSSPRARGKASKSRRVVVIDDSDDDVVPMDMSDDESDDDAMDCVEASDENHAPSNGSAASLGVNVLITDGPHRNESFVLQSGLSDTFVLGSNPKSKNGDGFRLSRDSEVEPSHVKLVLSSTKQLCTVRVMDLKSNSGTYLNGNKIPKGKEQRAFINDEICIGETTFKLQPLSEKSDETKKKARAARKAPTKKAASTKAKSGGLGVRLLFVEGPHEGEIYSLEENEKETVVMGTDPKKGDGESFCLDDDEADKSHAKLELVASKKLCSVQVTDLKSGSGTFVNGQQIPKGKNRRVFMNDTIQVGDSVMKVNPL